MRHLSCLLFMLLQVTICSFWNSDNQADRYISVKLRSTHQISNHGVGHDWEHFLSIDNKIIKKNEKLTIKLKKRAPLKIEAHAIEKDRAYDDSGKNSITFTYSDLIAITKSSFKIRIEVMENGGQNAGNIAEWMYIFEIARE